jgi:RHS repeat-associated protein
MPACFCCRVKTEFTTRTLLADGHGSTRQLVAGTSTISVSEQYNYDAHGVGLSAPAAPLTSYLYTGQQWDGNAKQYYLRARYYDPSNGRFNQTDPFTGNSSDPQSFHKYDYAQSDPINNADPSGLFSLSELSVVQAVGNFIDRILESKPVRFLASGFRNKIADVYIVVNSMPSFPWIHSYIFVCRNDAVGEGVGMHIGLPSDSLESYDVASIFQKFFGVFAGGFAIRADTLVHIRSKPSTIVALRVASFNAPQLAIWMVVMIPLGMAQEGYVPVNYQLVSFKGISCFSWTAEAAAAAIVLQVLPDPRSLGGV